ncbi:MAG: hypothetical protein MUC92_02475 [Fimbriimonadaceae bacterium]|nr:hypothetical protein [Fimbriimonadaceae bacterium]
MVSGQMIFTKYPSPANFSFLNDAPDKAGNVSIGSRSVTLKTATFGKVIHQIKLVNPEIWTPDTPLVALNFPAQSETGIAPSEEGSIAIPGLNGETILTLKTGSGIGLSGLASIFRIELPKGCNFFGGGQKNYCQIELSGKRSVNWNTDLWSDFHFSHVKDWPTDPSYFTTPYLAVELPSGDWVGLLLHNPAPTFFSTPGKDNTRAFVHWELTDPALLMGSYDGEPNLVVIVGNSLAHITQILSRLIGVTPLPPLWSLGFHQSRWGYGGHDDLMELDRQFTEHKIPCSGLWLDLDYMDGYRIFKTNESLFPKGVASTAAKLAERGRRIVPIIDPGVKFEKGYRVYDDGSAQKMFCLNHEGKEYIGMVWPGHTVFPDFTQQRVRDWWAGYAQEFRESGFGACWVDMNDPSTGPIDPYDMLFQNGTARHWEHRNQFALGMQMATHQGFLKAKPNERPFILSRSGFTGSSRYAAIWTGDNVSNDFYLRHSVTTTIGMGLSGHVFTGSDIGGFGQNCSGPLMERWMQAAFLFPFCRNHSSLGTTPQEPFAFPKRIRENVAHYIRLRYKFMAEIYRLFIEHEEQGDPIIRPLNYEFSGKKLALVNDQFMIGRSLLQAPILSQEGEERDLILPGKGYWFDLTGGTWVKAGKHRVIVKRTETPLYLRDQSLVAIQPGEATTSHVNLNQVEILVGLAPYRQRGSVGLADTVLYADDGLSFDYKSGKRTAMKVVVESDARGILATTENLQSGFGEIQATLVFFWEPKNLKINGKKVVAERGKLVMTGKPIVVWRAVVPKG